MLNTTDDDANSSFEVSYPESLVGTNAAFLSFNIFFAITTTLGNVLILIALHKVTSIHPPTKLLFRCLAVTDLCVGLLSQPLFTVKLINEGIRNSSITILDVILTIWSVCSLILCAVSLLTSTAISVDRLLALMLGLRYRHVVTLRRVRALIIFCWFLVGGLVGCITLGDFSIFVYIVLMLISLIISTVSFAKIYFRLRQQLLSVQGHHHQEQQQPPCGLVPTALNLARYKKTVSAIAWVQLGLFACYSPFCVTFLLLSYIYLDAFSQLILLNISLSLLYLNSSLNPILYCWKIREVKKAVKDIIR
ncbi:adenosine receptor A1-like [Stylophora pistillata]|uniref:adenosine receptor A1-like n=1 Tax=Stylophora pistillata TaxID=50429 RepID=UPI000C051F2B|nr:adenosine receptor A1-like [Stylophora pistillata]